MDRATIQFIFCQLLFRNFISTKCSAWRANYAGAMQTAKRVSPEKPHFLAVDASALRGRFIPGILCVLLLCWAPSVPAQQVIVNQSVPLQFAAKSTLRAIFGMRLRNWPDNTPITVFVLANDQPVHVAFSKNVLNMFPHQLQRAWDRLVYSGTGQAPIVVGSLQEMAQKVGATPGAVGYMDRAFINGKVHVLNVR